MTSSTENFTEINVGSVANDGTGDTLREAFTKTRDNFGNITNVGFNAGNINVSGFINVAGNVFINNGYIPTANNSPGNAGQISWDSGNLYICILANTWVRTSLTSTF